MHDAQGLVPLGYPNRFLLIVRGGSCIFSLDRRVGFLSETFEGLVALHPNSGLFKSTYMLCLIRLGVLWEPWPLAILASGGWEPKWPGDCGAQGQADCTFCFVEGEAIVIRTQSTEDFGGDVPSPLCRLHITYRFSYQFAGLSLLRLVPRAAAVSAVVRTDPLKSRLKVAA